MSSATSTVDDLLKQGITAAKAGDKTRARELLLLAIEVDDHNELAWLWLSGVVESNADRRVCLENVLTINPTNAAALKGMRLLDEQASPAEKCPHCGTILVSTGNTCTHCHKPLIIVCPYCADYVEITEATCPHCQRMIGDFRRGAAYYLDLMDGYQALQDHQLMISTLELAAAEAQANVTQLLRIGTWFDQLGHPDRAVMLYRDALTINPDSVALYLALGKVYQQSGQLPEAYTLYHNGLKQTQNAPEIMVELARVLAKRDGPSDEALNGVKRALQQQPELAAGHLLLAELLDQRGETREAKVHYRRAAALTAHAPHEAKAAQQALEQLDPALPAQAEGWGELTRQMLGLLLCPIAAALTNAQLKPLSITLPAWGALVIAAVGSYLWISAQDLPRNPLSRAVFGRPELRRGLRWLAGMLGFSLWLLAFIATLIIE